MAVSFPASPPALSDVGRALAVFAHPDDAGFGCAGTIPTWAAEGVDCSYLLVTRTTPESAESAEAPARRGEPARGDERLRPRHRAGRYRGRGR
ncbi:PIG-L deacetylase family protein [Micromonospora sp. NPDC048868]|uniref:PIG-L deacetylase family protein n=1 Tax=Micromonospora sp. NPDC048868 TaxID=3364258 RepID=UPI003710979C